MDSQLYHPCDREPRTDGAGCRARATQQKDGRRSNLPEVAIQKTKAGYANREMARGYMDAIKDATEGKEWCFVGVKPDEMNEDISLAIRKLPPAEQQDNAAKLVVATLHRLYPCNGGAR